MSRCGWQVMKGAGILVGAVLALEGLQRYRYYLRYHQDVSWLTYGCHQERDWLARTREAGISPTKPPGSWRVFALGDSITYGVGVPRELAYPAVLERQLQQQTSGTAVDVVNLGIPGIASTELLRFLRQRVRGVEADGWIIMVGWNDLIGGIYEGDRQQLAHGWFERTLWWLQRYSVLIVTVREKFAAVNGNIDTLYADQIHERATPEAFRRFQENLDQAVQLAQAAGIPCLLVQCPFVTPSSGPMAGEGARAVERYLEEGLPADYQVAHQIVDAVGRAHHIPVVDPTEAFVRASTSARLFTPEGIHLTPEGHQLLGAVLARSILEQAWLASDPPELATR